MALQYQQKEPIKDNAKLHVAASDLLTFTFKLYSHQNLPCDFSVLYMSKHSIFPLE